MKTTFILFLFSGLFLFACSSTESTNAGSQQEVVATYACPMKCEGDKTYTSEGECPDCRMDLTLIE